jgi:hypothetical protein
VRRANVWTDFVWNISCGKNSSGLTSDFACLYTPKDRSFFHDNCNKAKRLVRLVDSMRSDRDFGRGLRIGFCRSKQERRNLETDSEE